MEVSADGKGVVSHAGVGLLRETAQLTGLVDQITAVLADIYSGLRAPCRVFCDLAVADGADCVSGIGQLVDQQAQHGPIASIPTTWRLLEQRTNVEHLPGIKAARAAARVAEWAAGAAPEPGSTLTLDVDAAIVIDHSEGKQNAAGTWKHTFGHHPLLVFLDRPEISGGEALAALLRRGNGGSVRHEVPHGELITRIGGRLMSAA